MRINTIGKIARRFLIGWLLAVGGLITYEWDHLPRPYGYLVDAVDPKTGEVHGYGEEKMTWSQLDSEIERARRKLLPPIPPTASELLFQNISEDSRRRIDESLRKQGQYWDEKLDVLVPRTTIENVSERNRLLAGVLEIPEVYVSEKPEVAMRLARLRKLKIVMGMDEVLTRQVLDPEFNGLSKPTVPRLLLDRVLQVTLFPIAVYGLLEVILLLLRRRRVQLHPRETDSLTLENEPTRTVVTETSVGMHTKN